MEFTSVSFDMWNLDCMDVDKKKERKESHWNNSNLSVLWTLLEDIKRKQEIWSDPEVTPLKLDTVISFRQFG